MKWKLPILLIFLNVLLFGFVGYKLQNSHKEAIQKNIISEQFRDIPDRLSFLLNRKSINLYSLLVKTP